MLNLLFHVAETLQMVPIRASEIHCSPDAGGQAPTKEIGSVLCSDSSSVLFSVFSQPRDSNPV